MVVPNCRGNYSIFFLEPRYRIYFNCPQHTGPMIFISHDITKPTGYIHIYIKRYIDHRVTNCFNIP